MSSDPDQPELQIKVDKLPATARIKLWKEKPKNIDQTADFVFVIDMI